MNKQTEALKHLDYADRFLDAGMYAQAQDEIQACKETLEHFAPSWQGLSDTEIQNILACNRGEFVAIKKAEQLLKDKNGR